MVEVAVLEVVVGLEGGEGGELRMMERATETFRGVSSDQRNNVLSLAHTCMLCICVHVYIAINTFTVAKGMHLYIYTIDWEISVQLK